MGQGLSIYNHVPVDAVSKGVFDEMANQNFIATKVLPNNPSLDPYKGEIYKMLANTDQLDLRSKGARERAEEIQYKESSVKYETKPYKTSFFVDPFKCKKKANPAKAMMMERQNGVIITTRAERVRMESLAASLYFNTSNFSNTTPETQWSTTATAKPIKDLNALAYTIGQKTGIAPNTIIFGHKPWRDFASNETLLSTRSSLKDQVLTQAQSLELIRTGELEYITNIFVGRGSYTSSNQGQSVTRTSLWGNFVWIGYVDPNPRSDTLNSATFAKYEMANNSLGEETYVGIREFQEEEKDPDALFVEARSEYDYGVLDSNLGYLLTSVSA